MKLKLFQFLTLIFSIILFSSCLTLTLDENQPEEDTEQADIPPKVLHVGVSTRTPFLFKSGDKELSGVEIDILKQLESINKSYKLEFTEYSLDELPFALKRNDVDFISAAYTTQEIKEAYLEPCGKHFQLGERILVSSDIAPYINDISQIDNSKITIYTVVDSTAAEDAKKLFKNAKKVSLFDINACIKKVLQEKGNVMLVTSRDIEKIIKKSNSKIQPVLDFMGNTQIALGVRKNDKETKQILNDFINTLKDNEFLDNIQKRPELKDIVK
jgi:hypothetical protein